MVDQSVVTYGADAAAAPRSAPHGRTTPQAFALRSLDVAIASLAILFFLPLMVAIAGLVFMQDGGNPIFAHRRIGRYGRNFPCLKFRSMVVDADERLQRLLQTDALARAEWASSHKLRRDPRITGLGHFLRKSSLDELPQLFNVLRGEMSIVGPRPIVNAEIPRYGRRFWSYCALRPGITGLWQATGRSDTTYRRRVAMDHVYTRHVSIGLYLWILIMTVPAVLSSKGSC